MRSLTPAPATGRAVWPVWAAASTPAMPAMNWACKAWQMPFDLLRAQHAQAVRAGLIERSILGSRAFERRVDALETLCLGPFARSV